MVAGVVGDLAHLDDRGGGDVGVGELAAAGAVGAGIALAALFAGAAGLGVAIGVDAADADRDDRRILGPRVRSGLGGRRRFRGRRHAGVRPSLGEGRGSGDEEESEDERPGAQ